MVIHKLKRVFCIITAGVLMLSLSLVNGCTSKKDSQPNGGQNTPTPGAQQQTTVNKPLYPIADKTLTLSYWVPMHPKASQFLKNLNENEAYQEYEKKTGIHMNFIHPATGQEKEQFNILIASGDLPDIIGTADSYSGGEFRGVNDGLYVNLQPYLEKSAPDYNKLINSNPELKREVTGDGNVIAAFYRVKLEQDPPWRRVVLNQEWLNELKLEIPKTIDDYDKMFKAIKEQKNIAPYALLKNGMEDLFTGAFNVIPGFYLKDPKTVSYGQMENGFKDYITLMNKWYAAGYISKDFPSMDNTQDRQLFNSEKAGAYVDSVDTAFSDLTSLKKNFVPAPYPRLKPGDQLHNDMAEWPKGGDVTAVSSKSKYIKEAITWLNYSYSVEGSRLMNYGVENKSWTMVNGQPKFTDYLLKYPNMPNYTLKMHFAPKLCDPDVKALPALFINPGALEFRKMWSDDKNVDKAFRLPPIKIEKAALDRRAKIMTEVETYSDEMVLKFIVGTEPLSNYSNYINQLKKLGIEEAIKITQDAYTAYIK